jgi:uncharacterized protein (TIGR02145 family)
MKKNYSWALFAAVLMFFGTLQTFAQVYTISFTGSGKSTTVESVEAQNVTKGTSVTVPGGDVLVLTVTNTAINPLNAFKEGLRISNSTAGSSSVSFYAKQAGNARISVYSMDGRKVAGYTQNLQKGTNSFQVSLRTGAYAVSVQGAGYSLSGKLISINSTNSRPEISFLGVQDIQAVAPLKSTQSSGLDYSPGDIMLYKGISGNYATIVTDKPTASKTVNFNFIECKDASGNYYATVKIGNQIWMAENLKTTKYRSGADIPNITLPADWGNTALVTGAWCYRDNMDSNNVIIGKLYNWWAANDTRNIAPLGWHVPSIGEYDTLGSFLGGKEIAAAKMKDPSARYWVAISEPPATNESGFSARGTGKCSPSGVFNDPNHAYFWTTTPALAVADTVLKGSSAFMKGDEDLLNLNATYSPGKRGGMAIRCVMDDHTIKSISFYAGWAGGTEMWDFMYDPKSSQVTKLDDYWDGSLDKTITYDYSVPGKLTLMRDGTTVYGDNDLNDQGYIVKDMDGNTFEYDANGFLVKYYEYWDNASHLKYVSTISNGNITKITTYDDDGVTVKKIKEFTYTTTDNAESIHQANAIDSDWKPIGNFYGKSSAKLLDYFEYWDPRVNPVVKSKSTFGYTLDSKNRVSKAVKTLQDSSMEEWSYTYHD